MSTDATGFITTGTATGDSFGILFDCFQLSKLSPSRLDVDHV